MYSTLYSTRYVIVLITRKNDVIKQYRFEVGILVEVC